MKLKTATILAAITLLVANLFTLASDIRSFIKLSSGELKWQDNELFILGMPVYLLAFVALNVFLFVLAAKQKTN